MGRSRVRKGTVGCMMYERYWLGNSLGSSVPRVIYGQFVSKVGIQHDVRNMLYNLLSIDEHISVIPSLTCLVRIPVLLLPSPFPLSLSLPLSLPLPFTSTNLPLHNHPPPLNPSLPIDLLSVASSLQLLLRVWGTYQPLEGYKHHLLQSSRHVYNMIVLSYFIQNFKWSTIQLFRTTPSNPPFDPNSTPIKPLSTSHSTPIQLCHPGSTSACPPPSWAT